MYKAMVMDDEPWVIKTLVDSVKWSDYQFEVVATSSESRQGFEMIRTMRPDLVFIDIRMPEMNGLECMKQARALQLPTRFVVVSGFAEFSYAQKCMQLGAVGYCLKPIDEDEIEALLKKVKEELDVKQSKEAPSLIERITEDLPDAGRMVEEYIASKGLQLKKEQPLRAVCCLGTESPLDVFGLRYVTLYQGYGKTILLMEEQSDPSIYIHFASKPETTFKGIGISSPISRYDQLKSAIEEAELAAREYFLTGNSSVCQASDDHDADYSELRDLYPALQRRDMTELDMLFNRYLNRLKSGQWRLNHALLLYHTAMTMIVHGNGAEHSIEPYLIHDYEQLIERYQTVEEMVKDLKRMTIAYLGDVFSVAPVNIRSDSFKAVLTYMHENYHDEITLQKLSETFYINPNYISQLFIKHLGKPFTGYLAELRVRKACYHLKNGNKSIQEIAAEVGIPDPYYFSKIFRKNTGLTPRDYRKSSASPF